MIIKLLLLTLAHASLQASTPSSPTYEAGVVEFNYGSLVNMTSQQMLNVNLQQYIEFMNAAPSSLDIIVFPEGTLNTILTATEIPESDDDITPCNNPNYADNNLLKIISCSAHEHNRYVVINVITKAKCPDTEMIFNDDPRNCSDTRDGFSYYNTNIVFNRDGDIISSYRKYHLFGERLDKPYKPALVTFDTDFGVTFGHFICFDMHFRYPAVELVRGHKVTDIIFTSKWFSELPFLTAVQVQQYWAHSLDVNLLAAGANYPRVASTGSGIYGGSKGPYIAEMSPINQSKLYTAKIYKKIPQNEAIKIEHKVTRHTKDEMKSLDIWRDQLDVYDIQFLNDTDGLNIMTRNVCNHTVCCNIKVNYTIKNSTTKPHYQYAIAFYFGNRTFSGVVETGIAACAIIACPQRDIVSCGTRDESLENIYEWNLIEINGEFPMRYDQYFYMPSTLDDNILPLVPELFDYNVDSGRKDGINVVMKLNKHVDNLLTFGIWGRDFSDESDKASGSACGLVLVVVCVMLLLGFI
ncbi:vanin-like protein 1 [Chironomus tepperi]|uniref:vanin-like protein 1 n=1 Tax=Chironomus tepperi TaxID=113505 RepID=UPI00391F602D